MSLISLLYEKQYLRILMNWNKKNKSIRQTLDLWNTNDMFIIISSDIYSPQK